MRGATLPTRERGAARLAARPWLALAPLLPLYLLLVALEQPGPGYAGDEGSFVVHAERILDGGYADPARRDQSTFLWHGPATPLVITPFVALGMDIVPMRFLMAPFLFGAVLLFHRLLRTRLEPRAALAGAFAFALYAPFFQPLRGIHKEPIAILLVVAGMLGLVRYIETGRKLPLVLAGLAFAGVTMARLEFGWVTIAMIVACGAWWLFGRSPVAARRSTAVFAVALAGCVPWLAYTWSLTDRPLYWGNSGGISLYWMSPTGGPGETGQWHAFHTVAEEPRFDRYKAFFRRQSATPLVERNERFEEVAKDNIKRDPLGYGRNLVLNTTRMLFYQPFWPTPDLGLLVMYGVFNGLLVVGLAWAGVALIRHRTGLPPETLPIAAFGLIGLGIHIFPSADPRMVLTSAPPLIWLIVYAAARVSGR